MENAEDVARIKYILDNYDSIELAMKADGTPETFFGFRDRDGSSSKGVKFSKTMYANSEDFQVLAITTMVSSFVAEWNDRSMKLYHEWKVMPSPPYLCVRSNRIAKHGDSL